MSSATSIVGRLQTLAGQQVVIYQDATTSTFEARCRGCDHTDTAAYTAADIVMVRDRIDQAAVEHVVSCRWISRQPTKAGAR